MTTHHNHQLQGRTETELLWFRRRSLLQAASAWAATDAALPSAIAQQQGGNIVDLRGDALRNGKPLTRDQGIAPGDTLETGPGSHTVFTVGDSAFMVRANSRIALEGEPSGAVKVLRILTGGVASVWGKGREREVKLPTLTAGIRGTGVYAEVFPAANQPAGSQEVRSYFCNCYGVVELQSGDARVLSRSSYHQAHWGEPAASGGPRINPAGAINHTDEELEFLAQLVAQRTAWQIAGRKGAKDGRGKLYPGSTASPYGDSGY